MIQVRAVVFDVGEVLFHWDMRALFSKLIDDAARLDHFMDNVLTLGFHFRHDAGEELADLVAELTARHPEYTGEIHAYAYRFNETITGPVAGSRELVERLAARGVPIFGLTNFSKAFWAQFRPSEAVFDHFTDILVSGEEKLAKPDPAIYRLAEQRFGFAGEELIFADDREENIAGARACGWRVHHFRDTPSFEAELAQLGLLA
jgi:2-haloacid dehalogenase